VDETLRLRRYQEIWRGWFKSRRCQLLYQRPGIKRLASGAEVSAAVLHLDPLDGAAANGAGFASFMSNLEIGMGCASSPFVTCYLFQTLPDIRHEFKGHCIRRLGFQRCVFTDIFSNTFTLYQLFRIWFSFLVCVAEYS